jgi:acyl-coenzyme A thioesterase 13
MNIPAGFVPYARPSRYLDLIGPVYQAAHDPSVVGLLVHTQLTNSRGFLHAGVLVAIADTLTGHTAEREGTEDNRLVTVSMTTEFPGSAQLGQWITAPRSPAASGIDSPSATASSAPTTASCSWPAASSPLPHEVITRPPVKQRRQPPSPRFAPCA